MSFVRPFCGIASLAVPAVAALVLLAPALMLPARAQAVQQAALSGVAKSDSAKSVGVANDRHRQCGAAVDQPSPPQPKSLTTKAIEKAKDVAKSAGDIFSRVPCLPPKGGANPIGSLPHVAGKLASGAAGDDRRLRIVVDRRVRVRRRLNSPIPTGWRPNCTGNIRAPTSPSSIAARAARTRRK